MEDDNNYIKYNLAEKVTETLHTMCIVHIVQVKDLCYEGLHARQVGG